jgi:arylsulfatase A-like enzyme
VISEQSTGFPGYNSVIPKDKATIGRILLENGYATSWFGKDHNTPVYTASQIGPFDQWPTGMGFEYFYGFVGGDTSQWNRTCSATRRRSILTWTSPAGTSPLRWPTMPSSG